MSEPNRPAGPSFNAAWLLLLLVPAALFAGRLIAALPVPAARPAAGTSSPGAAVQAAQAQGGGLHWTTLAAAMDESRTSGKPLMLDFNAEWCPPCQRMKREAFENPAIARAVEAAVIPVSIVDRYREEGANPPEIEELQQRYGIEAFPTLVVLSARTGRFVKDAGYGGPEGTRDWILDSARQVK